MRWKPTELDATDVSLICSVLESVRVENEKFIGDLGDVVRHNLDNASEVDLVLLTKGTFYMRDFKHTKDLYAMVHAECMRRSNLKKLTQPVRNMLSQLITTHGIMTDSPFLR
jgi:hypothetical protein